MKNNRSIADDLTKQFKNLTWADEVIADELNGKVVKIENQPYVIRRRRVGRQTRYFVSSPFADKQGSSLEFVSDDIAIFELRLGDGVRINKRYFILHLPSLQVIPLGNFLTDESVRENLNRWVESHRSK